MSMIDPSQTSQQILDPNAAPQGPAMEQSVNTSTQPPPTPTAPSDGSWKTALAVIGGLMAGDRYPPNELPALNAGNTLDLNSLNEMTIGNDNQQIEQQAIAQENKMLNAQNSAPPGAGVGGEPAAGGDWRVDVLTGIGAPVTQQNLDVLAKWQKAEGGGGVAGGPTPSNYNWLNTTRNMPGSTSINGVGVKSYASYQDGVSATVAALNNGLYGNIIAALRDGTDEMAVADAIEQSPWGTGSGVIRLLQPGGGPTRMR